MKNASNSVVQKSNGLHTKKTSLGSSMAFADDSDEHDFFNPIQDLMPPSIVGDNVDLIGKKRTRDNDPLRRLIEDVPEGETITSTSPSKRQRITLEW